MTYSHPNWNTFILVTDWNCDLRLDIQLHSSGWSFGFMIVLQFPIPNKTGYFYLISRCIFSWCWINEIHTVHSCCILEKGRCNWCSETMFFSDSPWTLAWITFKGHTDFCDMRRSGRFQGDCVAHNRFYASFFPSTNWFISPSPNNVTLMVCLVCMFTLSNYVF